MVEVDYSQQKGCATEPEWDVFVQANGGKCVTDVVPQPQFLNADYLFPDHKVVLELKIIETEFGKSRRIERAYKDFVSLGELFGLRDVRTRAAYRRALKLIAQPLSSIVKKANRQIRETKVALDLPDWQGVIVCVNDNFRLVTPNIVLGVLARAVENRMSSLDGLVYLTNHYVEFPGLPYATFAWAPLFRSSKDEHLPGFVNWLGEKWGQHCENVLGEFDIRFGSDELTLEGVVPVGGPYRHYASAPNLPQADDLWRYRRLEGGSGLVVPVSLKR